MTPAAVKTAACQKRSVAMSEIETQRPLTRLILDSKPEYLLVVTDRYDVHQRGAFQSCDFRGKRSKKASHSVKRRRSPATAPPSREAFRHYIGSERQPRSHPCH